MSRFPFLAQRLFNVPLAITPQKAEIVTMALAERLGVSSFTRANGQMVPMAMDDDDYPANYVPPEMRPCQNVAGVTIIRVQGTLVNKLGCLQPYSGMSGYDGIRANLMAALSDDAVRGIMFDIDSPGGEVSGCFDLADTIYQARGIKPMWSVLNDAAYSAAYAIASATDRITVPRTGGTGSVGVICMHCDMSKAIERAGIAVTLIQYGARKSDGTETAPLSDTALARFQADVDTMGDLFVETVARNRGLAASKVRETEAGTYLGARGVGVGFANAVQAPDEAFRAMLSQIG
jgi:signal peptide peptidase SppA